MRLVASLLVVVCLSCTTAIVFPHRELFEQANTPYGRTYTVRTGIEDILDKVRSYIRSHQIEEREEQDRENSATITTQYVNAPVPTAPRQERRVAYQVSVTREGDRIYHVQLRCVAQIRGKYEKTWQNEPPEGYQRTCYSAFHEGLDHTIWMMEFDTRPK